MDMRKSTMALLFSVFLLPFGHVASAEERILPATIVRPATEQVPVTLVVAPVQTHQTTVVDRYGEVQSATVAHTVDWLDRSGVEEKTDHAPTLPYGAFFVSIGNTTAQPMTVTPAQLAMTERGKTHAVVSSDKTLDARWQDALWADFVSDVSRHMFVPGAEAAIHTRLPLMTAAVTIAPHSAWHGYVVFDVGATKRSDYTAFLRDAQQLSITLKTAQGPVAATFVTSATHLTSL
jgi:hypothetical protein